MIWCFRRRGLSRDEGGALAAAGEVDDGIVGRFVEDPYFRRMPPKSLDRDHWRWLSAAVEGLADADAAATLTACAAAGVMSAMEHCPAVPQRLLVTGAGG